MSGHTTLRGLYAITDTHLIPRDRFVATVEAAVHGGATLVQLREKDTPRAEIVRLGRAVLEVTRRYGALLIVNDHPTIAKEIGADGVHVGREDPPVAETRATLSRNRIAVFPLSYLYTVCTGLLARMFSWPQLTTPRNFSDPIKI